VRALAPDEGLELYATFEPRPLYAVMAELGFDAAGEPLANGDWRIRFSRRGSAPVAGE
jgi:hypothetical protein